ncbi:MAG: hypothetical protein K8R37_02955 [Bacteroidales bacterium]|nr:hypothetical protein [Bacteroidales bacterium]
MENFTDLHINDLRLNKKQFNRFLSIGLIFILFGYFYIVSPYFKYKTEEKKTNLEYETSKANMQKYTIEALKYHELSKNLKSELNRIKNEIHGFPDKLARSLDLINSGENNTSAFQQSQQSRNLNNRLGIPDSIVNYNDRVEWYINNWFEGITNDIRENIINPTIKSKLDTAIKSRNNIETLATNAIHTINDHIKSIDPDFWYSYQDGKLPVARNLEDVVEESLRPVFKEIDTIINISKNIEVDLRNKIKKDSLDIIQYNANIIKIEERIESVESPIGKIPLNLVDFVQLFPILIVILIVMLTNYIYKCVRLVNILRTKLNKMKIEKNEITFQNLTNCWFLPPYRNIFHLFMLVISVLIIVGIYILSVLHVIDHSEMFISFTGAEESFRKNLFFIAYGIGILIFFGCFWYIQKHIKSTVVADNNQL